MQFKLQTRGHMDDFDNFVRKYFAGLFYGGRNPSNPPPRPAGRASWWCRPALPPVNLGGGGAPRHPCECGWGCSKGWLGCPRSPLPSHSPSPSPPDTSPHHPTFTTWHFSGPTRVVLGNHTLVITCAGPACDHLCRPSLTEHMPAYCTLCSSFLPSPLLITASLHDQQPCLHD